MDKYIPTIGLEIHAELKTRTKMFCDCKNDSGEERPNVNICPVCLGHPGTLPVINREAVRSVLKVGAALGGVGHFVLTCSSWLTCVANDPFDKRIGGSRFGSVKLPSGDGD